MQKLKPSPAPPFSLGDKISGGTHVVYAYIIERYAPTQIRVASVSAKNKSK
jgi:hypothetical protein